MRKVSVGRVLSVLALAVLVAATASAQVREQLAAGGWSPTLSFDHGTNRTNPISLFGNLGVTVVPKIQVVADVSWIHSTEQSQSNNNVTAMGGVRYLLPASGSIAPFVEGLGGLGYIEYGDRTVYLLGFGGGIDLKRTGPMAIRFQVNYIRAQAFNGSGGTNLVRIGIGISNKK